MVKMDKFPCEAATEMLSMISPIYDNSYIAQWLFHVMGIDAGKAKDIIRSLPEEMFPETATLTLPLWEAAYSIEQNNELSIEERRLRILRKTERLPMNPVRLAKLLENVYGREFDIIEKINPYTFLIKTKHSDKIIDFTKLYDYVDDLKPAHMSYSVELGLDNKIFAAIGFAIGERKQIGVSEYTPIDPIEDINLLCDEEGRILFDANDLIVI